MECIKKIIRYLKDYIKNKRLERFYNCHEKPAANKEQWIIYMADGKMLHGGLSDRLCGLVSTYCYCKEHNKTFKAFFQSPYQLENFLLPNKYDWTVNPNELSYNKRNSIPVYISYRKNNTKQRNTADKKLNKRKKQIHVYTNMRYFKNNFSLLFHELFKPSPELDELIKLNINQLGKNFISITFRFQQLLGDFVEGNFPILPQKEKEILINTCINKIEELHKLHKNTHVLVTSDSKTFLSKAKELNYVHTIPGEIVHMDFTNNKNLNTHLKSFVDLFVISKAQKIYLIYSDSLYRSSFAKTASFLSESPYEEIKI